MVSAEIWGQVRQLAHHHFEGWERWERWEPNLAALPVEEQHQALAYLNEHWHAHISLQDVHDIRREFVYRTLKADLVGLGWLEIDHVPNSDAPFDYAATPPASLEQVQRWESTHDITLPGHLRAFFLELGQSFKSSPLWFELEGSYASSYTDLSEPYEEEEALPFSFAPVRELRAPVLDAEQLPMFDDPLHFYETALPLHPFWEHGERTTYRHHQDFDYEALPTLHLLITQPPHTGRILLLEETASHRWSASLSPDWFIDALRHTFYETVTLTM